MARIVASIFAALNLISVGVQGQNDDWGIAAMNALGCAFCMAWLLIDNARRS